MRKLAILILPLVACGEIPSGPSQDSKTFQVSNPINISKLDESTPEPRGTAFPTETAIPSPTPTPRNSIDDCPGWIPSPVWTSSGGIVSGIINVHCRMPDYKLPSQCSQEMAYGYTHDPNDGFYALDVKPLNNDRYMLDTNLLKNGKVVLYCSPVMWNGLWYSEPAELEIDVEN